MQQPRILCLFVILVRHWTRVLCDGTESSRAQATPEIPECDVKFSLKLPNKPEGQHKAPPRSSHHPQAPVLTVGVYQWVELHCTCCCTVQEEQVKRAASRAAANDQSALVSNYTVAYEEPVEPPGLLQYHIISTNGHVIVPTERKKLNLNTRGHVTLKKGALTQMANCDLTKMCIELYSPVECEPRTQNYTEHSVQTQGFYLYADYLGHSEIRAQLVWIDNPAKPVTDVDPDEEFSEIGDSETAQRDSTVDKYTEPKPIQWPITDARIFVPVEHTGSTALGPANQTHMDGNITQFGRWEDHIEVTILLRPQKFYLAADWSAAVIAFMIAISVGCCNDPVLMSTYLRRPKPILLGLTCQLIVMPLVSLGIGGLFSLNEDQAYGLFVVATVPGGGLAYLFTYLGHGERHLTAALSLITSLVDTVTSILWTFGVGWYWFKRPMHMGKAVGWLLLIAFGQAFGTIMRGCRPSVAHGILTWITRPLLLLAGILMITLGVYINHYAFTEFNQNLILSLLLLITCGFSLGWIAGQVTRQEIAITRTLATEAAVFNGLLCIPLLRTTVHAPEGDLAAIVAVWATFLAPIPLVYHGIVSVIHHWLTDYCQRRKKQKEENGVSAIIANAVGNGSDMGELGATSVAAVAAAAIAVAPAIAAGPKDARVRRTPNRINDLGAEGFVNISECGDLFETRRGSARGTETEHIPMSQTSHELIMDRPLIPPPGLEHEMTKHNPGRSRSHAAGQSKSHKSQLPIPKTMVHSEDQVLPYLLSDYDPRSVGKQMAYAQHHRHHDESIHTNASAKSISVHATREKIKPPPYTNL